MLSDNSKGFRREISGITTADEMRDAMTMLQMHGVTGDAEIHTFLHVGWTGQPVEPGEQPDPLGRSASIAVWAMTDREILP
jgi:hypothetical protein